MDSVGKMGYGGTEMAWELAIRPQLRRAPCALRHERGSAGPARQRRQLPHRRAGRDLRLVTENTRKEMFCRHAEVKAVLRVTSGVRGVPCIRQTEVEGHLCPFAAKRY
jgi:hypothetical protein